MLIRVGEFIYPVDFAVIETQKMCNIANQVLVILGHPFLTTINAIINCGNGMMRLFFSNMILELNTFNMQRQSSGFDDIEFSALNWVEDSVFVDDFDNMFTVEYESFFVDDKLETYALLLTVYLLLFVILLLSLFSVLLLNESLFLTLLSMHS